jgi:tetratricopeptide (TPR) repeat protein
MYSASIFSQTSMIDSLERVLATSKEENFDKVKAILTLSNEYIPIDTAKSRAYIMDAIDMSKRNRLEDLEAFANFRAGSFYRRTGRSYIAHNYYKKAEKLALKIDNKSLLCGIYVDLAALFVFYNDYDNAIYYTDKVLEIASEWYDPETLDVRDNVAPEVLEKANEWFKIRSTMFLAQYLAGNERHGGNTNQEALDFNVNMFQKAMQWDVAYSHILFFAYQSAFIYLKNDRPQEALYYLHLIREDFETDFSPAKFYLANAAYSLLAEAYSKLNQLDLAEYYLGKFTDSPSMPISGRLAYLHARSSFQSSKGDYKSALETFRLYQH